MKRSEAFAAVLPRNSYLVKKLFASSANDEYAVLDKFSVRNVSCDDVSGSRRGRLVTCTRPFASCLDGDILTELGEAYEQLMDACCRVGRQREVEDRHWSRSWR